MIKVTIRGETYSFDDDHYQLAEAIELERGLGMPFSIWKDVHLPRDSAVSVAVAGFVYLVLKRNGRDVPLADIISGKYELDTSEVTAEPEGEDEPEGPTIPRSPQDETSGSPS